MNQHDVMAVLDEPLSRELLGSGIPARLAYTGLDGDPRVIPIGFLASGAQLLLWTLPGSAKVAALRRGARVALTIDTQDFPPRALLLRGSASLRVVDGVPDGYVEAARTMVPPEQMPGWEAGVRALYRQMVEITVRLDWAKLLDFETTLPQAVDELVRARGNPD